MVTGRNMTSEVQTLKRRHGHNPNHIDVNKHHFMIWFGDRITEKNNLIFIIFTKFSSKRHFSYNIVSISCQEWIIFELSQERLHRNTVFQIPFHINGQYHMVHKIQFLIVYGLKLFVRLSESDGQTLTPRSCDVEKQLKLCLEFSFTF